MSPLLSRQMAPGMFQDDPYEGVSTNQARIIGGSAFTIFLSFTATLARLVFRKTSGLPLKWDDYWIVVACIVSIANAVCFLVCLNYGFGYRIFTVPPQQLGTYFKLVFATFYLYGITITSIKISILLFYRRVFLGNLRKSLYTFEMLSVVWFISFVFITSFQCAPISKNWDNTVPGTCIDYLYVYIAVQVWNILMDIGILILPMRAIAKLQLAKSRKISVFVTFLLGGLSIVFAIIRLSVLVKMRGQTDITFGTSTAIWSLVEPAFQIFCISLPCYTPVLKANHWITSWSSSGRSLISVFRKSGSSNTATNNKSYGSSSVEQGYSRQDYVLDKPTGGEVRQIYVSTEMSVRNNKSSDSHQSDSYLVSPRK